MSNTERMDAKARERRRLAEALRENLKRRKVQQRERLAETSGTAERAAESKG